MTEYEKKCLTCKHNYKSDGDTPRCNCMCANHDMYEPITNFERIKAMSIEEMAELFDVLREADMCLNPQCADCHECFYDLWCSYRHKKSIEWLESEVINDR